LCSRRRVGLGEFSRWIGGVPARSLWVRPCALWGLLCRLVDEGGPLDVLRNDGVIGEGGVAGVEGRWLEQASEDEREGYRRAKGEFEPRADRVSCYCEG